MGLFKYTNYRDDLNPQAQWKAGDPWDEHHTQPGYNDRDTELENYLNNPNDDGFSAVIKQNNAALTATVQQANVSIFQGIVDADFFAIIGSAGTINTEIKVTPTGLPPARLSTTVGGASEFKPVGTFVYREAAAGWHVGAVGFDDVSLYFIIDGSAGLPLGRAPSFAAANTDQFGFTLRYRYVVT